MAVAALLGDVLGSRRAADRRALHRELAAALDEATERFAPVLPLRITVGDDYQGAFARVGDALAATLWLRLRLLPVADVRHGVGWGDSEVLQPEPWVGDGPAWWVARDAIEAVEADEERPGSRLRRTAYRRAPAAGGPDPAAVEAALVLRDELVGHLDERSVSVLRGLIDAVPQQDIAESLGISASAVSQRVRAGGLAAIVRADALLRGAGGDTGIDSDTDSDTGEGER